MTWVKSLNFLASVYSDEPRPEVSSEVELSALLLGLVSSLLVSQGMLAAVPTESTQKSPPMELRATPAGRGRSRPCLPHCRASCHRGGCCFRQTPLTLFILVLVSYVFLISNKAICLKSLNIRISRHLKSLLVIQQNNNIYQLVILFFPYWFTHLWMEPLEELKR